jgi:hypothetical protein
MQTTKIVAPPAATLRDREHAAIADLDLQLQ